MMCVISERENQNKNILLNKFFKLKLKMILTKKKTLKFIRKETSIDVER